MQYADDIHVMPHVDVAYLYSSECPLLADKQIEYTYTKWYIC
jgi:hypothetical protein